jgi:membrane-bound lytic murein transglycosylase D
MFKRKLSKAALFALSFILMAASYGSRSITEQRSFGYSAGPRDSSDLESHAFDSSGLCVCLPSLTHHELTNAPRIQLSKHVSGFVKSYVNENAYFLEKIRNKSSKYFDVIDSVFASYDLPVELKYLAVIESQLNPNIYSKAGAAGLWQLMPAAARSYGLKITSKYDERRNANKSTIAAAKLLVYLNNMFDDWLLTIAAYNSGPGRVLSAIKKSGSRNFWVLQNYLPLETRKHVKKFIGMHYFFEGHGSLTTLTKSETQAHISSVAKFIKEQEKLELKENNDSFQIVAEPTAAVYR